jgi:short-subunit dehydrogenase
VNTASIAGLAAGPFMGPYNASKHAVVALSETLYHEMAMTAPQVKVSVLCPGWVRTRIADSARNRPVDAAADAADGPARALLQSVIERGMPPEELAAIVLAAIRAERFWILPHDDAEPFWREFVNGRAQALIDRENPAIRVPPPA